MEFIKDWYADGFGDKREDRVKEVFEKWYKRNLVITRGTGKTAEEIFGLAYTSSSDFAALWNCNGEAYWKEDPEYYFEYLAIRDNDIIVGLSSKDEREKTVWIGCCIL